MPSITIEAHRWRGFKHQKGIITAGFISIAWRFQALLAKGRRAMEELRAVARGEDR